MSQDAVPPIIKSDQKLNETVPPAIENIDVQPEDSIEDEVIGEDVHEDYLEDVYCEDSYVNTNIYRLSEFGDGEEEGDEFFAVEEEEEPFISVFDILDAPRELPEPIELDLQHLKQIANELGLIKLCWPEIKDVSFESRTHFPESYLKNTDKEKLLLFYAENFRRQFHYKYPNRKPLFLAADNECGQQKMVCTTVRPTTLPHTEIEQWHDCASFVGDHLIYEPLEAPTLISILRLNRKMWFRQDEAIFYSTKKILDMLKESSLVQIIVRCGDGLMDVPREQNLEEYNNKIMEFIP